MDEEQRVSGAVRAGMVWGGIGGLVGFAMSLLVPYLGGLFGAILIGALCGRRAVGSGEEGASRAGLVSGSLASPVFVLGAASGTALAVQRVPMGDLASTASEASGVSITAQEAWQVLILAMAVLGLMQGAALILTAVLAAGRAANKEKGGE